MTQATKTPATDQAKPWWKYGHVWMVLGGPLIVIVASMFTLYLAVSRPDPVTDANYYQKGLELNKTLGGSPSSAAPAMQARNHAATGVPKPIDAP